MTETKDIHCSNCNRWLCLVEYIIDDPSSYKCNIRVDCAFCGDKSWIVPINYKYKLGLMELKVIDVDEGKYKNEDIFYVRTSK